jgi:hypothetical protein
MLQTSRWLGVRWKPSDGHCGRLRHHRDTPARADPLAGPGQNGRVRAIEVMDLDQKEWQLIGPVLQSFPDGSCPRRLVSDVDGKVLPSARVDTACQRGRFQIGCPLRDARQDRLEGDLGFHSSKARTKAEMGAEAESGNLFGVPVYVEAVGILEPRFVAIGSSRHHHEDGVCWH